MPAKLTDPNALSPREKQVAELLLAGKSRSEIAVILNVGLGTVKQWTEEIRSKADSPSSVVAAHLLLCKKCRVPSSIT